MKIFTTMIITTLLLFVSITFIPADSLYGQATIQPVPRPPQLPSKPTRPDYPSSPGSPNYPDYPNYPGYPMYPYGSYSLDAQYRSARDVWAEQRKEFSDRNKESQAMTGGKIQTSQGNQKNTEPKKDYSSVALHPVGSNPPQTAPAYSGTRSAGTSSAQQANNAAIARENIKNILTAQIGVPYSADGETPEAGFSPVGLIKYVARRLGFEPKCHTAAQAWERAGVFIDVPYGDFKTGDFLFFKLFSKSAQKDELFMALVLDDKYMVYPSFSRKKVIKRSYLDDFWRKRFVGAKRVPPAKH